MLWIWKPPCSKRLHKNKPNTYCKKIIEKKSRPLERAANKDIRTSSTWFFPNTCNIVFSFLNNRTRPPFVIAWTVLNLDHAQLNGFWSFWSYKADEKWADWEGQKGESAHLDLDRTSSQEQNPRDCSEEWDQFLGDISKVAIKQLVQGANKLPEGMLQPATNTFIARCWSAPELAKL